MCHHNEKEHQTHQLPETMAMSEGKKEEEREQKRTLQYGPHFTASHALTKHVLVPRTIHPEAL